MKRTMSSGVMLLTPNLDIGGAQETVLSLAKYLPRKGVAVVVCTFRDGDLRSEIEEQGVPVEIVGDRRHSVLALPWFLLEMRRRRNDLLGLCERHGVSVVQTQGLGSLDFLAMTLANKVQVWWTIQNAAFQLRKEQVTRFPWLFRAKRLAHRILYFLGHSVIDGVIAVSGETSESYSAYSRRRSKVFIVHNAVDTEMYPAEIDRGAIRDELGVEDNDRLGIVVATFKRQKGHEYLVAAVDRVAESLPHLKMALVGDGDLRPKIEAMVAELGLTDRFLFLGSRRDVPELLAASDMFVLSSLWEGLSVALLEAMASEVPVIATDVSGTRSLVIDGETGTLVAPGDADALAAALLSAESDESSGARARRARELVTASYSAASQAGRLVDIFGLNGSKETSASRAVGTPERS
jgi:glycosyltransferase involved in cell wall biosynthesis